MLVHNFSYILISYWLSWLCAYSSFWKWLFNFLRYIKEKSLPISGKSRWFKVFRTKHPYFPFFLSSFNSFNWWTNIDYRFHFDINIVITGAFVKREEISNCLSLSLFIEKSLFSKWIKMSSLILRGFIKDNLNRCWSSWRHNCSSQHAWTPRCLFTYKLA